MSTVEFKLATWNIHRCIGGDGVQSRSRCAAVLQEIDADITILQEIESTPGQAQDLLAYFASLFETIRTAIASPALPCCREIPTTVTLC